MPWDSNACVRVLQRSARAFLWVPTYRYDSANFPERTTCHLLVPTKGI